MLTRPKSFSILYGIQRTFLTIFYLISTLSVFWLIYYLLNNILHSGGTVIILVSILYLVLIVLGYSMIHVISYIPANIAGAFDPIKNAIANRSMKSSIEFAGRLANFICDFFNFAFFDISFTVVCLNGEKPVASEGRDINEPVLEIGKLENLANSLNEAAYAWKIKTGIETLHLYVLPIIFGESRLGFIVLASRQKLWNIFIQLLNEFENDFVDDQLVHILEREK